MNNGKLLVGLQYLRFVAAMLVVLHHAWQMVPIVGRGDVGQAFPGGAAGVDIFFVISGFIMVYISEGRELRPSEFFLDRLTRVGPPYWIVTAVLAAILVVAPSVFKTTVLDWSLVAASLAFIPWPNPSAPGATPLLQVGWTLNYEMFFYLLFSLSMLLHYRRRAELTGAVILALAALGALTPSGGLVHDFATSTMMVEFGFGMVLGLLFMRTSVRGRGGLALLCIGSALLVVTGPAALARSDPSRFLIWGLPAAAIVAGVIAMDAGSAFRSNGPLLLLGNSSYSIYLTHLFVLGAVRKAWSMVPDASRPHDIALLGVAAAMSIGAGVAFHLLCEKPSVRLFRRILKLDRSAKQALIAAAEPKAA